MDPHLRTLLLPDERVLRRERQHPAGLLLDSWPAMALWALAVVLVVIRVLLPDDALGLRLFGSGTWLSTAGTTIGLLALGAGIALVGRRWWRWRDQAFLVTDRRVVLALGPHDLRAPARPLESIEEAALARDGLGRLLDYADLTLLPATAEGGAPHVRRLDHAAAFRRTLLEAREARLGQPAGTSGEQPAGASGEQPGGVLGEQPA